MSSLIKCLLLSLVCVLCIEFVSAASLNAEGNIRAALLTAATYDKKARPYTNESNRQISVTIDVALNQIIDMDDRHEVLTTALWVRLRWTDQQLTWNSASYSGVTTIRAGSDEIWVPDITVYNDVRSEALDVSKYPISITNDGSVKWLYPLLLKSTCKLDVTYFPYDQQICKILFGSWTYTGTDLDLLNYTTTGDLANLVTNSGWDVVQFSLRRHNVYYGCCPDPYPDVTYYVIMRRKSLHYVMSLIVPCIVLMLITICGFYLPPASGERISLGITNLLALVVFLLVVAENMPPQSDSIPLIERYFAGTLGLLAISLILFIGSLQLYFRAEISNCKPPQWLRYFCFNVLALILCQFKIYKMKKTPHGCCGDSSQVAVEPDTDHKEENGVTPENTADSKELKASSIDLGDQKENENEWQIIAIIFDRISMVIIGIIYLILSLVILLYQPVYNMDPESKTGY